MRTLLLSAAVAATLLGGCTFYFGGDDDDDCLYAGAADLAIAVESIRNPDTGYCEDWWGGGGGGCYNDGAEAEPQPDWASCYGYCEGLDEATCLTTDFCRAAYYDNGLDGDCAPGFDCGGSGFLGCWGTAPSGTVEGACEGLDAYGCSQHDECSAHYVSDPTTGGQWFSYCAAEGWATGCYSDADCALGYECNADEVCGAPPGCGMDEACPDVCYGSCVPANTGCEAVDCAPGTHCEIECYPCDSAEPMGGECDPTCNVSCVPDTNACEGVECGAGSHCEVQCDDSFPGSCWSTCVGDTAACEELTTEAECDARTDCVPLYTGYGCTMQPDGTLTCATWEYARCETGMVPL